jgi:hypothetical protein
MMVMKKINSISFPSDTRTPIPSIVHPTLTNKKMFNSNDFLSIIAGTLRGDQHNDGVHDDKPS